MSTQLFQLLETLSDDDLARRMASFPPGSREHRLCEQELARRLRTRPPEPKDTSRVKIFISHTSKDKPLAEALVELLGAALGIAPQAIRSTSVDGYKLPAGAKIDPVLQQAMREAETFIGIITDASIESAYVFFELGARWNTAKHLTPLLAGSADGTCLQGPLSGYHPFRCDNVSHLSQLIEDIGKTLGTPPHAASNYQAHIQKVVSASRQRVTP
jgi:hypothetical protein